jgi:hypothetical protein
MISPIEVIVILSCSSAPTTTSEVVSVPGASSLRVHFRPGSLAEDGAIRVTSRLDGQAQVLDAAALEAWSNSSAYFNGDTVIVDLVGLVRERALVERVEPGAGTDPLAAGGGCQFCGICGKTDDRVPTDELWVARLLPSRCTAFVIDRDGCMVTAGHCAGAGLVAQFNVPPSDHNCGVHHPPIADQFPLTVLEFESAGPGADWAILQAGANSLGQTPFERYGELRPVA